MNDLVHELEAAVDQCAELKRQRDELLTALQWLLYRAAPEWETESGIVEYAEACRHARSLISSVKGGAA